jgi:GTP-dependent phosphoenolpyruvate carboxykinase
MGVIGCSYCWIGSSDADNYHDHRNWLNNHRFCVNSEQCARINKTVERLDALPKEVGLIYFGTERFETHPDMEESYLTD